MPSISVHKDHCLYIQGPTHISEKVYFEQQCKKIINWQSERLTANALLGLSDKPTTREIKVIKMKMGLHFHPDRNKDSNVATEAFKVIYAAADYLAYCAKVISESEVQGNCFYSFDNESDENTDDVPSQPEPEASVSRSPEQEEYESRLASLHSSKTCTPMDEEYFRQAIAKHPEFLKIHTKEAGDKNLMTLILEHKDSVSFFQWLVNSKYGEETILQLDEISSDAFSHAAVNMRQDCLKVLFDTYGIDTFRSSSIWGAFGTLSILSDGMDILRFIFDELGYRDTVHDLSSSIRFHDAQDFERAYIFFTSRGCTINNELLAQELINTAGATEKLQIMHDHEWITPQNNLQLFNSTAITRTFLAKAKAKEIMNFFVANSYSDISSQLIKHTPLNPSMIEKLFTVNPAVTVEDILKFHGKNCLNNPEILNFLCEKDSKNTQLWLNQFKFEELSDTMPTSLLSFINKQKWTFSEEQWSYIERRFDRLLSLLILGIKINKDHLRSELSLSLSLIECLAGDADRGKKYLQSTRCPIILMSYNESSTKGQCQITTIYEGTLLHLFIAIEAPEILTCLLNTEINWNIPAESSTSTASLDDHKIISTDFVGVVSPYELLKQEAYVPLAKKTQLLLARVYLSERQTQEDYKTKITFFGFNLINFGFSKKQKVAAAEAFINYLENNIPIPELHKPALSQGRLGEIVALSEVGYVHTASDNNSNTLT